MQQWFSAAAVDTLCGDSVKIVPKWKPGAKTIEPGGITNDDSPGATVRGYTWQDRNVDVSKQTSQHQWTRNFISAWLLSQSAQAFLSLFHLALGCGMAAIIKNSPNFHDFQTAVAICPAFTQRITPSLQPFQPRKPTAQASAPTAADSCSIWAATELTMANAKIDFLDLGNCLPWPIWSLRTQICLYRER